MKKMPNNPTSSPNHFPSIPAKHPIEAAQAILDQIPQRWESVAQLDAVKRVVRIAMPPPRPRDIVRASTILYVASEIDRECYRLVWRYVSNAALDFGKNTRPKEEHYPVYFALQKLYCEGRKHHRQGTQAVRLLTSLARKHAARSQFAGRMYYRHILALRQAATWYWKKSGEIPT